MKYTITVGTTTVSTDELASAVSTLFALAKAKKDKEAEQVDRVQIHAKKSEPVKTVKATSDRKITRPYKRICPECGKGCYNKLGLGVYRARAHGVAGKWTTMANAAHAANMSPNTDPWIRNLDGADLGANDLSN